MSNDPAIEEVRRARIELSRELGNDPKKFLEYFRAVREEHRRTGQHSYVTPPSRKSAIKESAPPYQVSNDESRSDH
jgi:hypothetical protein